MADGKKPQKGGKRPEVNTAFEIPEDIYAGYCTPPEEDKNQRKVHIKRLRGDGLESGGSTDMSLPNT